MPSRFAAPTRRALVGLAVLVGPAAALATSSVVASPAAAWAAQTHEGDPGGTTTTSAPTTTTTAPTSTTSTTTTSSTTTVPGSTTTTTDPGTTTTTTAPASLSAVDPRARTSVVPAAGVGGSGSSGGGGRPSSPRSSSAPRPADTAPAASSHPAVAAPPAPTVLRLLGAPFSGHMPVTPAGLVLLALFVLVVLFLTFVAGTTLWWMLHAWRTPDAMAGTGFLSRAEGSGAGPGAMQAGRVRSFSLIVPARHEEAVLGTTLRLLARLDHPDYEVLAVVGHDDHGTRAVADEVAREHPERVRVLVDWSWPKNKPKALNTALGECRGAVTGVFDAEDEVHPELLRHVDHCFDDTGADVVQGGVQLMNYRSSWWALHNVLEYYFWFRSRLHFHAGRRFIPLGGNTVFIRTDLLRSAGGWDGECLAEDCELGVRLSTQGATVAVAYEPGLVTREETPPTVASLLRQRTRWNQGFLQVLRKGVWRGLPTLRQRMLARYTLSMPFLQAFAALLIPLSALAILALRLPVAVALLSFVPLIPTVVTVTVQAAGLREFCRNYGERARLRDYLRLAVGTLPYQTLLGYAAMRAVSREVRGSRAWEKTVHVGAHRQHDLASATGAP